METLPNCPDGDRPNRRVEAGNISSSRENADNAFLLFYMSHNFFFSLLRHYDSFHIMISARFRHLKTFLRLLKLEFMGDDILEGQKAMNISPEGPFLVFLIVRRIPGMRGMQDGRLEHQLVPQRRFEDLFPGIQRGDQDLAPGPQSPREPPVSQYRRQTPERRSFR